MQNLLSIQLFMIISVNTYFLDFLIQMSHFPNQFGHSTRARKAADTHVTVDGIRVPRQIT